MTLEQKEEVAQDWYNAPVGQFGDYLNDYLSEIDEDSLEASVLYKFNTLYEYIPGSLNDFIDWVIRKFKEWIEDLLA